MTIRKQSREWRDYVPVAVFTVFAILYVATADAESPNRDVYSAGVGAWRIAESGTPWLESLGSDAYDTDYTWLAATSEGHLVVARGAGVVAAGVPAYWVSGMSSDGFTLAPQAVTASLLSAGGILMFYVLLSRFLSGAAALVGAVTLGLGTPIWSIAADGMWTHTLTVPGLLGMTLAASRDRWWLAGAFGGVAIWGRLHVAVIVAAVGLVVAATRRRPGIAVCVGLPSLAMLGLASLWTRWHYGNWSPAGAYSTAPSRVSDGFGGSATSGIENQLGLWIAPDRGFLIWTPLVLVLLPAMMRSWKDLPDWARVLPGAGVAYTLIQGQLNTFTGGDGFFGYRHTLELLCCLAPWIALSVQRVGPVASKLVGPLIGLQIAAFSIGAISEGYYVVFTDAWRDNSIALAARTEPIVIVWLILLTLVGGLGAAVLTARARPTGASS